MGVGKGGRGGPWPGSPPGFSRTLSKTSYISKILPFLAVNTGSILIGTPLKNFLPTPLLKNFLSKGEFSQYPFFVRFRPFFYVFASP